MSEWREYLLEDVIDKFIDYRGKTPDKKGSGIPLVTAKIVKAGKILPPNEFIAPEDYDSWMTRGLPEIDDIVLTTEAPLGEIALIKDRNVALAQRIITLRGKKNIVFNPFLKYYFQDDAGQHELQSRASGTTVFGIKASVLKKVPVSLPPLLEQKAIAVVLSCLDDKIDLLHRRNLTLEAMAETLFRQWFVVEAKEDWEEKPLRGVVDIAIGRTPPRQQHQWFSTNSNDIKWISIKDLGNDGVYIFKTSEYLTQAAVEQFNVPVIPENTVVLSFKMTVGRVAITTSAMLSNEAIAHFKFNKETPFTQGYLYLFLKTFKYDLLGSTSSIVTSINSAMIKDMEIVIPDDTTMKQFESVTKPLFRKIRENQKQIQTLESLRDTLLPKLMSGEVRVNMGAWQ
jgi:type I restriction enzyme S subunit